MKNKAQSLLQLTSYPLEPIVALAIQKNYQSQRPHLFANAVATMTSKCNALVKASAAQKH